MERAKEIMRQRFNPRNRVNSAHISNPNNFEYPNRENVENNNFRIINIIRNGIHNQRRSVANMPENQRIQENNRLNSLNANNNMDNINNQNHINFYNNDNDDNNNNFYENYNHIYINNNDNINQNNNFKINNDDNNMENILEEIELSEKIIDKAETKECPICLMDYYVGNKICYLPCFHFFHSNCIKDWIKKSKRCPLCNIEIKFD